MDTTESVIRRMTRLAVEHDAVNLSQGFTDEPPVFDLVWAAASHREHLGQRVGAVGRVHPVAADPPFRIVCSVSSSTVCSSSVPTVMRSESESAAGPK